MYSPLPSLLSRYIFERPRGVARFGLNAMDLSSASRFVREKYTTLNMNTWLKNSNTCLSSLMEYGLLQRTISACTSSGLSRWTATFRWAHLCISADAACCTRRGSCAIFGHKSTDETSCRFGAPSICVTCQQSPNSSRSVPLQTGPRSRLQIQSRKARF